MFYLFWRLVFKIYFILTCRLKISGSENIPKKGPFILAGNHVSYLDPILLGGGCKRKDLYYMARHTLFKTKFWDWVMRHVHAFPVKRDVADMNAFKTALRHLNSGHGLTLFPEGTRSLDGSLQKPEPGIGFLVSKSRAVVVPAYVGGTNIVLPKGQKKIKHCKITVIFGKPIVFDNVNLASKDNYMKIAQDVMDGIASLSKLHENN